MIEDEELQSLEFWKGFREPGLLVQVNVNYAVRDVKFSRSVLEDLVGMPLGEDAFSAVAEESTREAVRENDENIRLLQRHTWEQLCAEPTFTYAPDSQQEARTFQSWVKELAPSHLVADLVINGYITPYFALHVSSFYGKLIRPDAMTYVMRYVDHGLADTDYPLGGEDVEAILKDQGSSVLGERSMLNVGIFDHLLAARFADAKIALRSAQSAGGTGASDFVERYLEVGAQKQSFAACMASLMPDVFIALAGTTALTPEERVELIDIAINNRGQGIRYAVSPEVRSLIESHYLSMPSLATAGERSAARQVVRFLETIGVVLSDLRDLGPHAIVALRETQAWSITLANLEVITGSDDISLDAVARSGKASFSHIAARPDAYASAFRESTNQVSVVSSDLLVTYLRHAGGEKLDALEYILTSAAPDCLVDDLSKVPAAIWHALVRSRHAPMTVSNVIAYVDEYDEIDDDLAAGLAAVSNLEGSDGLDSEGKVRMALALVNSPSNALTSEHRVRLAKHLQPGELPTSEIRARSGSLVGELIRAGLVADAEEAFSTRLMIDWTTQAAAIARSKNFVSFVGPTTLSADYVALLLRDAELRDLNYPVVKVFPAYSALPRDAYVAYAERALAEEWQLNFGGVRMAYEGGVGTEMTVSLTSKFIDRLTGDELREILRLLGKPWETVADPGYGLKELADTPPTRVVLEKLRSEGVVSKYAPYGTGKLRVSLRRK